MSIPTYYVCAYGKGIDMLPHKNIHKSWLHFHTTSNGKWCREKCTPPFYESVDESVNFGRAGKLLSMPFFLFTNVQVPPPALTLSPANPFYKALQDFYFVQFESFYILSLIYFSGYNYKSSFLCMICTC